MCVPSFYGDNSTPQHDRPFEMDSAPTMIISRFILNLRRSDRKNQAVESRFSRFAASGFHVQTLEGFIGEMGQPLDHGFRDQNELDEDHDGDVVEAFSSLTHTDIKYSPSHVELARDAKEHSAKERSVLCPPRFAPVVLVADDFALKHNVV